MTAPEEAPVVGSRLIVGKNSATIRYIGPVDGQEGVWAGLEWDDPTRGKHDGSHGGRRYFTCQHHSGDAGSFVRLPKLLQTADLGQTLEQAIQTRYKPSSAVSEISDDAYVPTASQRRVPIRLVGAVAAAEAVCLDGALEQASFLGMRISSLDLTPSVTSFLSRVAILDLSNNLISNWPEVAALAAALPSLHTLNLSGNLLDLHNDAQDTKYLQFQIPSLKTLVLNGCGVTWSQAVVLASGLPNLQGLHLCGNNLSTLGGLGESENIFSNLEILDLEDNQLSDWSDIATTLQNLPKFASLLLSGNNLTTVLAPGLGFAALEHLMLGNNQFQSWGVADALDQFLSLTDLRLSDNPITTMKSADGVDSIARYEAIARISKLKTLNGGVVSPGERWDAELAYLRTVTDELAAAQAPGKGTAAREAVLAAHPKYNALVAKYGELTSSQTTASKGTTMGSTMVELVFVAGSKHAIKKVPGTLTIGRLKPLLERVLRVKIGHQAIMLVNQFGSACDDVTQQDGKELRFFEVANGWRVELKERGAGEVEAEREAVTAEQVRRMMEHEMAMQRLRAEEEKLMIGPR